jgi:hypothetical protein
MLDFGYLVSRVDGTNEIYDRDKIFLTLKSTFDSDVNDKIILFILEDIEIDIQNIQDHKNSNVINIEDIKNTVEKYLMIYKYYDFYMYQIFFKGLINNF